MFPTYDMMAPIFNDTNECIKYLIDKEVLYKSPKCKKCHSSTHQSTKTWRCNTKGCGWRISIFNDTIFAKSRLEPTKILRIAYFWLSGCSHSTIEKMTNHSSATISNYLSIFRKSIAISVEDTHEPIGGPGIIVEIDESKFGKRKYHKGKMVEGVWIVGGVERTTNCRLFAERVTKRDEETLLDVIERNVLPGSIIHTDMWKGYNLISSKLDIIHKTVNHSKNFVNPETGTHTNTIEGTWNGIKIHVPGRARHKEKVDNHISEFIWRRQNQNKLWDAFIICLGNTMLEEL